MIQIPAHYKLLAVLLGGFFLFGFGYLKGLAHERDKQSAAHLEQMEKSRKTEQSLQAAMDAATSKHLEEVRRIADERDAALDRLRKRPDRMPEASRSACSGSTGRELSEPDGAFLVRFAARADEYRAAALNCQSAYGRAINGTPETKKD